MKYLVWLGIEEKGTYDIIKKIAKKKFKEEELKALKAELLDGWVKRVGKEDGFNETWQVVEDAARYSFNASHSLSVAIDSLYGAYLKAHYPLEYFTVTLSLYSGDMERTANLISEMNHFGIELKPIKFRHSNANYNIDKDTNSIYKGVAAVKFCNEEVGNKLYELRDQEFGSFLDLIEVFPGNSRQLEILIKLGYFDCFGKTLKLIKLCDLYNLYGGKKIIKKDKVNLPLDLVQKYATSETAKQYRFEPESMQQLLREFAKMIPDTEIPLRTRLEAEAEFMGYVSYTNPKLQNVGFVLDLNTRYTPRAQIYMLDTGETITVKIPKHMYQKQPFDTGNILKFYTEDRPRSIMVDGEWKKDYSQTEKWVRNYVIKHTDL